MCLFLLSSALYVTVCRNQALVVQTPYVVFNPPAPMVLLSFDSVVLRCTHLQLELSETRGTLSETKGALSETQGALSESLACLEMRNEGLLHMDQERSAARAE